MGAMHMPTKPVVGSDVSPSRVPPPVAVTETASSTALPLGFGHEVGEGDPPPALVQARVAELLHGLRRIEPDALPHRALGPVVGHLLDLHEKDGDVIGGAGFFVDVTAHRLIL